MFNKPIIALVGKTNVGKSTLFNYLTRSRSALVANYPNLTRDRHYGEVKMSGRSFILIDTGGLNLEVKDGILSETTKQTLQAIKEANAIIFLVDARSGLTLQDYNIARLLRKSGQKNISVAINKSEGMNQDDVKIQFYELGFIHSYPISSEHGEGINNLINNSLESFYKISDKELDSKKESNSEIKLAIVGRPNVGKSTLINSILQENRVISFHKPGTTRDTIQVKYNFDEKNYILFDTAGLRKRGQIFEPVEKYSVVKTLQAIKESNVVLLILDGKDSISEQDAHIAGFILETGRSVVIAINKCENLNNEQYNSIEHEFRRKLNFLSFAKLHRISALKNYGIKSLFVSIENAYKSAFIKLSTPKVNKSLKLAIEQHAPRKGIFRCKMRYAHQGGKNPPLVIVHGTGLDNISNSYRRYLEKSFQMSFRLEGTPLRVEFRSTYNPYV
ncbi:MAG: ribosome biogenesis GTPase Der [Bordetella sp.]|nr:MAG: ribosome biogenesis GTPase Der [Bordetella sp.]